MLRNKKVLALITDGYHHGELTGTSQALSREGVAVTVAATDAKHLSKGVLDHITYKWLEEQPAKVKADQLISGISAADFDALFIPGGHSPGTLRVIPEVLRLVVDFYAQGKPVASLCRGPQVLISARIVSGKNITSAGSIADDLRNAGAIYLNQPLVIDGNLITSRTVDDLDHFNRALLDALSR